jgi:hypothetical protein
MWQKLLMPQLSTQNTVRLQIKLSHPIKGLTAIITAPITVSVSLTTSISILVPICVPILLTIEPCSTTYFESALLAEDVYKNDQ